MKNTTVIFIHVLYFIQYVFASVIMAVTVPVIASIVISSLSRDITFYMCTAFPIFWIVVLLGEVCAGFYILKELEKQRG